MALSEFAIKLHELPLLHEMPAESRARVAKILLLTSNLTACSVGDTLINQRDLGGQDGFVLIDGVATVLKSGEDPIELTAPALIGEMMQFNPRAQRTASVVAKTNATVLQFYWQDLYAQAKEQLSEDEQNALLEGIERTVLERCGSESIIDLPLFRGLDDALKVRACVAMQWLVRRVALEDSARLFVQGEFCGGTGYVLVNGAVRAAERNMTPRTVAAPNMIGVMPKFDADLKWSCTCSADGDADLLRFSWQEYMATLQRRVAPSEVQQIIEVFDANKSAGLAH